jgi:Domain of unknown function (DUF4390)
MRSCTALRSFLLLVLLLFAAAAARAEGVNVLKAESHFTGSAYELSANFDIRLKLTVQQALEEGVPLYFVTEFTLTRPRWYWFDEVVAKSEQTTRLSYNALTRQYRITRGALFQNFENLSAALRIIGHQTSDPIPMSEISAGGYISEKLFKKDSNYIASARLRLDVTQLPKPMQVNALTADDWNIDSDWYRWLLRADSKGE